MLLPTDWAAAAAAERDGADDDDELAVEGRFQSPKRLRLTAIGAANQGETGSALERLRQGCRLSSQCPRPAAVASPQRSK